MTYNNSLKMMLCAGAVFVLTACAATPESTPTNTAQAATEKPVVVAPTVEVAPVTTPETTAKTASSDAKQICKRQSVVGTNFKKKVCATAEQWQASEDDR